MKTLKFILFVLIFNIFALKNSFTMEKNKKQNMVKPVDKCDEIINFLQLKKDNEKNDIKKIEIDLKNGEFGNSLKSENIKKLFAAIQDLKSLNFLSLNLQNNIDVKNDCLQFFLELFNNLHTLETVNLNLRFTGMDAQSIIQIIDSMASMQNLKTLELSLGYALNDFFVEKFVDSIKKLKKLKNFTLNLQHTEITDKGALFLVKNMFDLPFKQFKVDLNNNENRRKNFIQFMNDLHFQKQLLSTNFCEQYKGIEKVKIKNKFRKEIWQELFMLSSGMENMSIQ